MSWLCWFYMIFTHYEVGKKFNSVWLDNNNIHICPIRTIQQEGTNMRVVVRWEEDIIKEVWHRCEVAE